MSEVAVKVSVISPDDPRWSRVKWEQYAKEIAHIKKFGVFMIMDEGCGTCRSAARLIRDGVLVEGRDF